MTNLPIAINDYVIDVQESEYTLYRIHEICVIDVDNDPTGITHEKKESGRIEKRLKILIEIEEEKYKELEQVGDFWYLKNRPITFIREMLIYRIDDYFEMEKIESYTNVPEHLKDLLKNEDYWSSKLMNDFGSIKNFHVMCSIRPICMTWQAFYEHFAVNLEMMLEISRREKKPLVKSIFDPIWRLLRGS